MPALLAAAHPRQGSLLHVVCTQTRIGLGAAPTAEELHQLAATFAALKAEVERDAPPEVRKEAVKEAEALEQATMGPEPDVSAMDTARRWFLENARS